MWYSLGWRDLGLGNRSGDGLGGGSSDLGLGNRSGDGSSDLMVGLMRMSFGRK